MNMNYRLSPYGNAAAEPSPVNRMMDAFASDFRDGLDINLGVGYVNENTIPSTGFVEAAGKVSAHPELYRQAYNYGGPQGSPNLIRALKRFYLRTGIGSITEEAWDAHDLAIGASGATSILDAIADIFRPGIVVTADPMYYIYCNYLERKGFRVLTVPEDSQGIRCDALEERLDKLGNAVTDLSFFYVVTVNNPSGVILSNARKKQLLELAFRWSSRAGHTVPVFFDQAYEWLIHDTSVEKPISALIMDQAGLAYEIGTLSKVLAPALRIGFILGPRGIILKAITQKTSDTGFSAPLINQEIAAHMLEHRISDQLDLVNAGYRKKAARIEKALHTILSPWLEDLRGGQAGFYFYVTLRDIATDEASPFFRFLARTTGVASIDGPPEARHPRVIYIPGVFCVHPKGSMVEAGRHQLRLSYGFEDADRIIEALHFMRAAAEYAENDISAARFRK